MKHEMYSIFDSKASAFLPPFFVPTEAVAIRATADLVNDRSSRFGMNPEDYSLYHVGLFDDETGKIESCDPSHIRNLITLKKSTDSFVDIETYESLIDDLHNYTKRVDALELALKEVK